MSLIKTAATAAVASSVHGRVQRRQQARWAAQDHNPVAAAPVPPAPSHYAAAQNAQPAHAEPMPSPPAQPAPAPSTGTSDRLSQLKQLGELLTTGILTQAEFDQEKARILST